MVRKLIYALGLTVLMAFRSHEKMNKRKRKKEKKEGTVTDFGLYCVGHGNSTKLGERVGLKEC